MRSMYEVSEDEKKKMYKAVVEEAKNGLNWKEVAERFDVKPYVITGIATRIRKAGIPLPKRIGPAILTADFIQDLKGLFESR